MNRMLSILTLALFLLAGPALAEIPGHRLTPNPEAPAEMAQLAFLAGEWKCDMETTNAAGQRVKTTGRWVAYYTLDGYAFQDDWYSAGSMRGTTWRTWHPFKKKWINRWLMANSDSSIGFTPDVFYGEMVDGEYRLTASGTDTVGEYLDRIEFTEIQSDSFVWRHHRSYDGGTTWIENMTVNRATRVR